MLRLCFIIILFPLLLLPGACTGERSPTEELSEGRPLEESDEEQGPEIDLYREEAARIALPMDNALLAAQCLLSGLDSRAFFSDTMKSLLERVPVGGIILFRYNLSGSKDDTTSFLNEVSNFVTPVAGVPPFMAVDHEGGMVHRFGPELTRLPPPLSFWEMSQREGEAAALEAVENLARLSGEELVSLGISLNLAPVAEILSPENQAFLATRSYGPDPCFTEKAASAFIRGMEAAGIACTIKHFPGNSAEDPHYSHSEIPLDLEALDAMIQPFRNIIRELHVPALMVSHSVVPAIDAERNGSLSPAMIGWIREGLGFSGIVVADDFSMAAVTARGISAEEAAVQALIAGADMIMCWPSNMVSIHEAILSALEEERLSRERLLEAAERIIAEKLRFGLMEQVTVNNEQRTINNDEYPL